VGGLKSRLMGEASAGERTAFDATLEFKAKELVQVLKVHLRGVSMANHII
jgi:hypothetical protein